MSRFFLTGLLLFWLQLMSVALPLFSKQVVMKPTENGSSFSIDIPEDWTSKQVHEEGVWVFVAAPLHNLEGAIHERLTVAYQKLPSNMGLNQFYALSLENVKETIDHFAILDEKSVVIGGLSSRRLSYTETEGSVATKVIQYFIVKGMDGYTITCIADQAEFPLYLKLFENSVQSFRLL